MYSKQKWEKQKYAYVIHTAVAQQAHDRVANITKTLIYQLKEKAEEHIVYIEKLLQESYRDISNSVVEFGFEIPEYKEIKEDFYSAIVQGVKVSVINAKDDINKYLNEDTGELKLRTPFSMFVGGQVLDRGNDLLSITRFYTTRKIYESMVRITEIDVALRDDIRHNRFEDGICFIERRGDTASTAKIVPCLTLLHQNGVAEGWKGREFWWPILTLPKNTPKTIYALPNVDGRIRKR